MDELTILAARRFLAVTWPQPCHRPVFVTVDASGEDVHLMPIEAERLMGMPEKCTLRHNYASEVDRMRCIGNGWDVNVVSLFFQQYKRMLITAQSPSIVARPASLVEFSSPASHGSTPSGSPCSPGAADQSADTAAVSAALSPHQQQLALGIRSPPRLRMQGTTSAVAGSTPLSSPSPTPAVAAQEHNQRNRDGLSVVFTATATARPKVYQAQQARRLKEKMAKVEEVLVHMGSRKPVWVRAFKLCVSLAQSPAELSHVVSSFDSQNERSTDDGILSIKKVFEIRCFGGGDVWGARVVCVCVLSCVCVCD